jgi:hypothetical protein
VTLDQIIAAVSGFASLSAAVAAMFAARGTFATVRQVQRQTEASYRPELTFSRVEVKGTASGEGWPIPSSWTANTLESSDRKDHKELSTFRFGMRLYNVGLAAATNIRVEWKYPIKDFTEKVNVAAQRRLIAAFYEFSSGQLSFKSELWGVKEFTISWDNEDNQSIDYLLPESVPTTSPQPVIWIPMTITQLVSAYIYFTTAGEGKAEWDVPHLDVKISYRDIAGVEHLTSFKLRFRVSAMQRITRDGPLTMHISIDPKKVA